MAPSLVAWRDVEELPDFSSLDLPNTWGKKRHRGGKGFRIVKTPTPHDFGARSTTYHKSLVEEQVGVVCQLSTS